MTPCFPGDAPCLSCSVFQPLLAGVAVAQSYVVSTVGHLFQMVVEKSALGMLNGIGESSQQMVAVLSFLLGIHKASVRRLEFVQNCLFGLLLAENCTCAVFFLKVYYCSLVHCTSLVGFTFCFSVAFC